MRSSALFAILAIASSPAFATVQAGDFVFVYAQILGCGNRTFVVDYAEMPDHGEIAVFDNIKISIVGLSEEEIVTQIVEGVRLTTGRTPKTISVEIVPGAESKRIAEELMKLSFPRLKCVHREERPLPPPDAGYIRSLAHAPPNKALH